MIKLDQMDYATDALARAAWKASLDETLTFYNRVVADGGIVVSMLAVDNALRNAKDNDYYTSLYAMYGSSFAYKLSGSAVTKVYDVSPNNLDLTGSGVTIASDGAFQLAAVSGTLTSASSVNLTNMEACAVSKWTGNSGDGNEHLHIGAASRGSIFGWNSNKPRIGRSAVAWDYEYGSTSYNAYKLYGVRWDGSNHYLRINGSAIGSSANAPTINSGYIKMGATTGAALSYVKHLLILNSASEDRTAIEAFINSAYSIY